MRNWMVEFLRKLVVGLKLLESILKSMLFIISKIVLRFYTQVSFCICIFCFVFSSSFSNYEQKTGKRGAILKSNNFHSFNLE